MIAYDDFSTRDGWPGTRWIKFTTPDYLLWDANTCVSCPGTPESGLTIRIERFSLSRPPHHVKALTLTAADFEPPAHGPLIAGMDMAVRTFGTERNPFGADANDPRLSAAAMVATDPEMGMVFDFFVSNGQIGTIYERLPYARGRLGPYPAFTQLNITNVPTSPGQWHAYEIRYYADSNRVEWFVDGKRVAQQNHVGAPPGRTNPVVKVRQLKIGGGLFTLLDDLRNDVAAPDDNPRLPGLLTPRTSELFGQGAEIAFRKVCVNANLSGGEAAH